VWVGDGEQRSLSQLESKSLHIARVVRLPDFPYRLAAGFGAVWVASGYDGRLVRVDGANAKLHVFRPEPHAIGRIQIAIGYSSVWAASQDGVLARLDPRSLRPTALIHGVSFPAVMTAGLNGIWIAQATRDDLLRVDPGINRVVRSIPIGGIAAAVAVGDGAVWAATPLDGRLWRINPRTNAVTASIEVGGRPTAIAVTPGAVWVGSADGTIVRIDPSRNDIVTKLLVGGPVAALASTNAGTHLWASVQ
jgi:hypothetical protein